MTPAQSRTSSASTTARTMSTWRLPAGTLRPRGRLVHRRRRGRPVRGLGLRHRCGTSRLTTGNRAWHGRVRRAGLTGGRVPGRTRGRDAGVRTIGTAVRPTGAGSATGAPDCGRLTGAEPFTAGWWTWPWSATTPPAGRRRPSPPRWASGRPDPWPWPARRSRAPPAGCPAGSGGGVSRTCRMAISSGSSPSNGRRPARHWYATTPSA